MFFIKSFLFISFKESLPTRHALCQRRVKPQPKLCDDFQIILFSVAVLFIYVFRSPSRIFVFTLSPFFVIYMYYTGGGRKRQKPT
jgi:hypothetical protein